MSKKIENKEKLEEKTNKSKEPVKENKKNNNENLKKNSSEKKSNKNKEKSKKDKGFIIRIILIIAILVLATVLIIFKFVLGKNKKSETGNTIGNIRNFGYIADDANYLYFMSPNDEGSTLGIRKISKNDLTGKSELLVSDDWQIAGLNCYKDYLYFITMTSFENTENASNDLGDSSSSDTDTIDNKIYKMKTDGTELTVINDNEFNNGDYQLFIVNDKIYYIGIDECIYTMDLEGNNKTKLNDNASGFIGVTDDYIFYNKAIENSSGDQTYVTYMMNIDGSNEHPISDGELLYDINIVDGYIYYITKNRYISRMKLDGTDQKMLSDQTAYRLNVTNDGIYYLNYYQVDGENAGVAIYRMDLDGSNVTELTKLDKYTEVLCEFDNYIFYSDTDGKTGKFEIISKDGKQNIVLYSLDLSKFGDKATNTASTNSTDENNEVANSVSSENVDNSETTNTVNSVN